MRNAPKNEMREVTAWQRAALGVALRAREGIRIRIPQIANAAVDIRYRSDSNSDVPTPPRGVAGAWRTCGHENPDYWEVVAQCRMPLSRRPFIWAFATASLQSADKSFCITPLPPPRNAYGRNARGRWLFLVDLDVPVFHF